MITYWASVKEPQGQRLRLKWRTLFERFERPLVRADKLALPGWSPATFHGDIRALANVELVHAVGLDIDSSFASFDESAELWRPYAAHLHTTHSSTDSEPRFRVVILPTRPMTAAEYARVRRWCARRSDHASQLTDTRAADPSRLWFVPGCPAERVTQYRSSTSWGAPLDVDAVLRFEPEAPPAPPCPVMPMRPLEPGVVERARAYLERCGPAISGQGGHTTTLLVAQKLTVGFALDDDTALALLSEWNRTCAPPWSTHDLKRKIRESRKSPKMAPGELRDRERR
jgi:hypothetical protein